MKPLFKIDTVELAGSDVTVRAARDVESDQI